MKCKCGKYELDVNSGGLSEAFDTHGPITCTILYTGLATSFTEMSSRLDISCEDPYTEIRKGYSFANDLDEQFKVVKIEAPEKVTILEIANLMKRIEKFGIEGT